MKRRFLFSFNLGVAVCVLLSACGGGEPGSSQATPEIDAPTVVLVSIDTLRADRLGCYGREEAGTASIDGLAGTGVVFDSAQTTSPLTLPAHSSLLSGRTVAAHGALNNGTFALPESVPTLAEALEGAGWATGAFVSSPVLARRHGLAQGFDRYDDAIPAPVANKGLVVHFGERPARKTVDHALSWLMDRGAEPAFAWIHLWEPHAPYHPPAPFAERFADDRYQGEVAAADAAIGRLIEGLRLAGRWPRTLLIVTADHGEGLGDHGEPTHGVFLYRETMQVPLVVHGPGWGLSARRVDATVSLADVAPTVLELAEVEGLEGADGASFAGLLRGDDAGAGRFAVAESHLPQIEFGWSGLRAVVQGQAKLIDAPRRELYDLASDPHEGHNLLPGAEKEAARLAELAEGSLRRARAALAEETSAVGATSEELDVLRSLGYAASGRAAPGGALIDRNAPDPKDRADVIGRHDEAVTMMRTGRVEQAITVLEELRGVDPDNPSILLQLGQAQILAERLDDAERTFSHAVAVAPDFALAWFRLGQIRGHGGDAAAEEAAYRRSISADPYNVVTYKALASVLAQQGKLQAAIDTLEQARDLDPGDKSIRADLERFWAKTKR